MLDHNVLVIGKDGMAGHVIYDILKSKYNLFTTSRTKENENITHQYFEFSNPEEFPRLLNFISKNNIKVVINCIGVLNTFCDINTYESIVINSLFPLFLDRFSQELNYKLIHLSTDCVFSGKDGGYIEESIKDGTGSYAKTKSLGEEFKNPENIIIRTSIIGPEKKDGIGLLHWFLTQENQIQGYSSVYWSGVTTLELAYKIVELIENDIRGLIHLTNNQKLSKYDLLCLIRKVFSKEIKILMNDKIEADKSLQNTKHSKLVVPSYEIMIKDLYTYMCDRRDLYKKYFCDE